MCYVIIYNGPNVEIIKMSVHDGNCIGKQNVRHSYNGLSFNHGKVRNLGIYHNWINPEKMLLGQRSEIQGFCGALLCLREKSRIDEATGIESLLVTPGRLSSIGRTVIGIDMWCLCQ